MSVPPGFGAPLLACAVAPDWDATVAPVTTGPAVPAGAEPAAAVAADVGFVAVVGLIAVAAVVAVGEEPPPQAMRNIVSGNDTPVAAAARIRSRRWIRPARNALASSRSRRM